MQSPTAAPAEERAPTAAPAEERAPTAAPVWRVASAEFVAGGCQAGGTLSGHPLGEISMQLDQVEGEDRPPLVFARAVKFIASAAAVRQLQRMLVHPEEHPLVDRRGVGFCHQPGGAFEIHAPVDQWDGQDFVRNGTERYRINLPTSRQKLNAALAAAAAAMSGAQ